MLTERFVIGKLEVLEDGQIQVREDRVIEVDGVEIARLYHRRVLAPGDDTTPEIDTRLKAILPVVWTRDVVTAYQEKKARADEAFAAELEIGTKK